MSLPYALSRTVIVPCAMALSAACTYGTGAEEDYAKSFPVSGRADVHIFVSNAAVQVMTSDDPNVDFHVHYEIDGSDPGPPFVTRQDGNLIELKENDGSHDWWNWDTDRVQGTRVEVNGKVKGTIPAKPTADAILATWIGPNPGPGEDFKQAVLGANKP